MATAGLIADRDAKLAAVKAALFADGGVDASRVFLTTAETVKAVEGKARMALVVRWNLSSAVNGRFCFAWARVGEIRPSAIRIVTIPGHMRRNAAFDRRLGAAC